MKKVLRVILLSVVGSLIIVYGMQSFVPKYWLHMKEGNKIHRNLDIQVLGAYGLDSSLNNMVRFTWDKVCLFKDYAGSAFAKEKMQSYMPGYILTDDTPVSAKPWMLMFMFSPQKKVHWVLPCDNTKCIPISALQKQEECFGYHAVWRTVYEMQNDQKAKSTSFLLTDPENNRPENKESQLGEGQNYLKIYP